MSKITYSELTKYSGDSSDDENDNQRGKFYKKKHKFRSHIRDFLLVLTGFVIAFATLKALNFYEIEDNFYHDLFELEEFHNEKIHHENNQNYNNNNNNSLANYLMNEVRVLCVVTTTPENHKKKAIHIKRTWGKRCNQLIFASTIKDESLGSIALNVSSSRKGLWDKTKEALKYIYRTNLDKIDWILKADDDTFVIMENLRYFLYAYSSEFPIAFGCKLHLDIDDTYFSGGAGYVLSKASLIKLVETGFNDPKICKQTASEEEDVEIGYCLNRLNIIAGDSRDEFKRGRFHPLSPASTLIPLSKIDQWYLDAIYYKYEIGINCCSDYSISFHYVKPIELYAMEYILYHMKKPFGLFESPTTELPKKLTWDQVILKNKINLNETTG